MINLNNLVIIFRTYSGFNITVWKKNYIRDAEVLELINKACNFKNSPSYTELRTYFPEDVIILCDAQQINILYGVNYVGEN